MAEPKSANAAGLELKERHFARPSGAAAGFGFLKGLAAQGRIC
jgi:hypothetical protein